MCERFLISGRVQGVCFRAGACETARSLGLTGWVRNLPDGRVEALACGEPAGLEDFARWLGRGPPAARVEAVVRHPAPQTAPLSGFEII